MFEIKLHSSCTEFARIHFKQFTKLSQLQCSLHSLDHSKPSLKFYFCLLSYYYIIIKEINFQVYPKKIII